ncbi:MAG: arylesterase [Geminicoccaceae bacterium]
MNVCKLDHRQRPGSSLAVRSRHRARLQMDRTLPGRKAWVLVGVVLASLILSPGVRACRLAVLGDSLAAGYGVADAEAFPVRLEQALKAHGVDCAVLNAGVSGDTSAGGLARLDWVLADQPTHLLVELGGNDALRALPVEELRKNITQIIETAEGRGVQVILAGMLAPPNLGRSYTEDFKRVYLDLARAHDVPLYPFFLDGVVLQDGLMQPDGIHPNARGVDVIVERITPLLVSVLQDS